VQGSPIRRSGSPFWTQLPDRHLHHLPPPPTPNVRQAPLTKIQTDLTESYSGLMPAVSSCGYPYDCAKRGRSRGAPRSPLGSPRPGT